MMSCAFLRRRAMGSAQQREGWRQPSCRGRGCAAKRGAWPLLPWAGLSIPGVPRPAWTLPLRKATKEFSEQALS